MSKANVLYVYEEEGILIAKFHHPKSDDFLEYTYSVKIKNSGKNPIEMNVKFVGILPFVGVMLPKEHTIRASSVLELHKKIVRWLKKYGYILV